MKIAKRIARVLAACLAVLAVLVLGLYVGVTVKYSDYFSRAEAAFRIPGLRDGFVPQGFAYVPEAACYLASGYMQDHSVSRVYVQQADGQVRWVELTDCDGAAYTAHAGGIAVNGNFVYLPGPEGLDVFLLEDILRQSRAACIGTIAMEYEADCCTFYDGYLFVGDFYRPEVYETPKSHHVTTPAGDANPAMIAVYKADATAEFGLADSPVAAISVREQVQGIGITEAGEIVLSTSYGFASSYLWFYTWDETRQGMLELGGNQVPLYYLDSANLSHRAELPPMSEEVVCLDGKVYTLMESACTKYRFGNLIRGTHVYAYEKP